MTLNQSVTPNMRVEHMHLHFHIVGRVSQRPRRIGREEVRQGEDAVRNPGNRRHLIRRDLRASRYNCPASRHSSACRRSAPLRRRPYARHKRPPARPYASCHAFLRHVRRRSRRLPRATEPRPYGSRPCASAVHSLAAMHSAGAARVMSRHGPRLWLLCLACRRRMRPSCPLCAFALAHSVANRRRPHVPREQASAAKW